MSLFEGKLATRHHESGEEPWLISYANLMTLLFGFFVILFSFSSMDEVKYQQVAEEISRSMTGEKPKPKATEVEITDLERQSRALKLVIAALGLGENLEEGVRKIESSANNAVDGAKAAEFLRKKLSDSTGSGKDLLMESEERDDALIEISLPSDLLFASGAAELSPPAKDRIRKVALEIVKVAGLVSLEVVGHTDSVQPRDPVKGLDNWALSALRAGVVAREMVAAGYPAEKLSVRGDASLHPLFPEKDRSGGWIPENLAKNRRVALVVRKRAPRGGDEQ